MLHAVSDSFVADLVVDFNEPVLNLDSARPPMIFLGPYVPSVITRILPDFSTLRSICYVISVKWFKASFIVGLQET